MVQRCKVTSEPASYFPDSRKHVILPPPQVIHTGIPKFKFSQYHQKSTQACNVSPRRILSTKQVNFLHNYLLHPDSLKNTLLPSFPSLLVRTFDDIKSVICHTKYENKMRSEITNKYYKEEAPQNVENARCDTYNMRVKFSAEN